jgi:hypothetical protein
MLTSSLTLRGVRRLKVFENRVQMRLFGPKRDDLRRKWRRLHNEELNNLYSSPNIIRMITIRRMGSAGHVTCMGDRRDVYRV